MSLQDSTFKTVHVLDNEIIKASDFEFAFEQLIINVSKATQMLMESTQDFVINGKVIPDVGMNVRVNPIYGVCKSTGLPFGRTETTDETIGFEGSSSGRIDILEVKGDWETFDEQQRAFNDPDTDTKTYQYVDTKKLMKPIYQVKKGVEGSGVAPDVDSGWVKLAEVTINAGVSTLYEEDIHNITADVAGLENEDWTNQADITYNIGYISDVNERFRQQHNEDGSHKDNCINSDSLDIGTGTKQINGNVLPIGGNVSLPGESISTSDSILLSVTKVAGIITTIYNTYLKYGNYGFKGELSISDIADQNNALTKPITIKALGNGTAVIKIDGATVLSIDANGKLTTNGYTATANNNLITKSVTDAISAALTSVANRVTSLEEQFLSNREYTNKVLSENRYRTEPRVTVRVISLEDINLAGSQIISEVQVTDGDIVLVAGQSDTRENGIYQVSSSSAWGRVNDYAVPSKFVGILIAISEGKEHGKLFYTPKAGEDITIDDFANTPLTFNEYIGSQDALPFKMVMRDTNGNVKGNITGSSTSCTGNAATATSANYATSAGSAGSATSAGYATSAGSAGNADTVDGYHASEAASGSTVAARDANGYLNAVIFHDSFQAENINSYSSPKIMFKGNNDGYLRNTDPSNVSVGYATSAGSASSAGWAGGSGYANQLQAFTGDDFTGGNHFIKAIRFDGWAMRLWCCYDGGAKQANNVYVYYADESGHAASANTATSAGSAGSATSAGYATNAGHADSADSASSATHAAGLLINGVTWDSVWTWSGQSGQPTWLWGSNDGDNMYVYNPSNFSVNYAGSAGWAGSARTADNANALGALGWTGHLTDQVEHTNYWAYIEKSKFTSTGGYIVYSNGFTIEWGTTSESAEEASFNFPITFVYTPAVTVSLYGTSGWAACVTAINNASIHIDFSYGVGSSSKKGSWIAIGYSN